MSEKAYVRKIQEEKQIHKEGDNKEKKQAVPTIVETAKPQRGHIDMDPLFSSVVIIQKSRKKSLPIVGRSPGDHLAGVGLLLAQTPHLLATIIRTSASTEVAGLEGQAMLAGEPQLTGEVALTGEDPMV